MEEVKTSKFRMALIGGASLALCVCLACAGLTVYGMSTPTYKATRTAEAIASSASPTETPKPLDTATATGTDTLLPTETVEATSTSAAPAETFTPAASPTITLTSTKTNTPRPTNSPAPTKTPQPRYVPILGKLYAGVKVYYGLESNKAYGFEIMGGSENCPSLPSGRGVKVKFEDGTEEWKDRDYLVQSGLFFVREDDPAISKYEWYVYTYCP